MTLTETAYWTKRLSVVIGGFLFVAIIVLYVFLSQNAKPVEPLEYVYPQNTCTQTREEFVENKLQIPSLKIKSDVTPSYTIETPTGQFSDMPAIVNVYRFKPLSAFLTVRDSAQSIAKTLGFDPEAIQKPDSLHYMWEKKNPKQTFIISTRTQHFQFKTDFTDPSLKILNTVAPNEQRAIDLANRMMDKIGLMSNDFLKESPTTKFIIINPDGSFSEASSALDAQLIRIDYHRSIASISVPMDYPNADVIIKKYESKFLRYREESIGGRKYYQFIASIVTPDTQKSTVSVYVGTDPESGYGKIYQIDFFNWYIEDTSCGTYSLISPTVAFDKIQSGEASLVYLNDKNGDTVKPYSPRSVQAFHVYDMFLAYYDSVEEQKFLQPIYIVSGEAIFSDGRKGQFYFYVPAIDYDVIRDAPKQTTSTANVQ